MEALTYESYGAGSADRIDGQMNSLSNQSSQKVKDGDAAREKYISLLLSESPLIDRLIVLAKASGNPSVGRTSARGAAGWATRTAQGWQQQSTVVQQRISALLQQFELL
jgi:hypothetical protein